MPLERHAHADDGRLSLGELVRKAGNISRRNAGDTLDVSRGELLGALGELFEADRVSIDPLAVDKTVVDHRGDHAHGEGAVGAGFRHDVPVGLLGGARAVCLEWKKVSGATPPVGQTVSSHAVEEPEAQNVFSFTVEPSWLKKASPA